MSAVFESRWHAFPTRHSVVFVPDREDGSFDFQIARYLVPEEHDARPHNAGSAQRRVPLAATSNACIMAMTTTETSSAPLEALSRA